MWLVGSMYKCRARTRVLRIGICCWSEQKRSGAGKNTAVA